MIKVEWKQVNYTEKATACPKLKCELQCVLQKETKEGFLNEP